MRKTQRDLCFFCLLCLVCWVPFLLGQARIGNAAQALDEDYTQNIREYTTEPFFNSPWTDYLPASSTVPTPKAVLVDIAGAPNKLPYSADVHQYMRMLER